VRGYAELEESMRLILGTAPGERPRRPEFGCGVHDLVFDAVDAELASRVAAEVQSALLRWEPRIDVLAVHVAPDPGRPAVLLIDVEYAVRDTNDARNLVVPFYALPGEDA
jgi:phage baseplate assembly protein W